MTSIADVRQREMAKYNTTNQKYKDFEVGDYVEVITPCQDFTFFNHERGVVIRNSKRYLGIIVEFDKKYKRHDFNFEPKDLINLGYKVNVRVEKKK